MSLYQRDFILRLIESVAATLRRVRKRRDDGDLAGARAEIVATMTEVLGPSAAMVPMVDAQTAANLVSDPQRVALYCQLLEADADLLDGLGHTPSGSRMRTRALELLLELVLRRAQLPDETIAQLGALVPRVDAAALGSRYHTALGEAMRLAPARSAAGDERDRTQRPS